MGLPGLFTYRSPSAHKYSYRDPPDIVGHVVSLQNSETVP